MGAVRGASVKMKILWIAVVTLLFVIGQSGARPFFNIFNLFGRGRGRGNGGGGGHRPSSGYGAPSSGYGAPSSGYGAPAAAAPSYSAPSSGYGAPAAAPSSSYNEPSSSYNEPSSSHIQSTLTAFLWQIGKHLIVTILIFIYD